ncbi:MULTISPECIES: DUF1540 domain-containing protein [Paraclostridium]|uniref:DUF1540 domain-containing protein n=1 Tax=Paraclostridium benzoelyticum TaxID=1629550 RepID=A0A0M3DGJ7_9FIRM|nr:MULTISPECIES: DUF1540 domain-containing protein [Paraclostridium]KKY01750.1 hypothetical protein VN21_06795 [Paraclostridium benzoelyticum]MCU9813836.1 DUF1540 domain-containing protein [Paraclostridium sp. AKS73]MDM8127786.1 DUF1540 domain-containing protein [Paraclostridium benzoelyticum]OXX84251.1 hypothetical protein AVM15_05480 [Paraclostridium benzoelyticum]
MSNPINCSATSCAYNNSGGCYASGIQVKGSRAKTTSQTNCATYQDKASSSFTNCSGECTCAKTHSISCAADHCKHNDSGCCKAESVQINMQDASCETFVTK